MVSKYQRAQTLREDSAGSPTELEMQALWFEQFYLPILTTDDGESIKIIQSGDWNHGAGPDFFNAAIRLADGSLKVGEVEMHLQATDWQAHGHEVDSAYENTILHVVWNKSSKPYFPATKNFRYVPQVYLADQLVAPWEMIKPHLQSLPSGSLPIAKAGFCQKRLSQLPEKNVWPILREAGLFRLRRKAERLYLRTQFLGFKQMLWEALAEGLGYSQNKLPFRLLAQRLPYSTLKGLKKDERMAYLFGVAGFLPEVSLQHFQGETKKWIQPQWDLWWKVRDQFAFAILAKQHWKFSGLRPWNRPERRLAALAHLVPKIDSLEESILSQNEEKFARILSKISDPFWDFHASISGSVLAKDQRLIGDQRIHDLLINIFWPLVYQQNQAVAEKGLAALSSAENKKAEIARQRLLSHLPVRKEMRNALNQQGLLQIYQDYCLHDQSGCKECVFPDLVAKW